MRMAIYQLDGDGGKPRFIQSVNLDPKALPDLPEGFAYYDFVDGDMPAETGETARVIVRIDEDHRHRVRRVERIAVPETEIERRARQEQAYGGAGALTVMLDLQNQVRALRSEPPLTFDQYLASLG